MSTKTPDLRSELGKVRGLGASRHAVGHWWLQRVTAVAMIPLSLWFTASLVTALLSSNVIKVAEWFASPVNTILMVMFLGATFIHVKIGVQVIIEDYVKGPVAKYGLLLANTFICFAFAGLSILAVLKLHLLDIGSSI